MKSWSDYFELSKNRPPNPLLETAVNLVVDRQRALDLGAGSLKDSKFMLSVGFKKVTAVDRSPQIKKYRSGVPARLLSIQIYPFEELAIKPACYNLISAQYALPFTGRPHLPALMKKISDGLRPAGIFCAQFFGRKDSWNDPRTAWGDHSGDMTFVTRTALQKMLAPLQIIYFQEEQKDAQTIDGQPKHWHLFHVIALKPLPSRRQKKKPPAPAPKHYFNNLSDAIRPPHPAKIDTQPWRPGKSPFPGRVLPHRPGTICRRRPAAGHHRSHSTTDSRHVCTPPQHRPAGFN